MRRFLLIGIAVVAIVVVSVVIAAAAKRPIDIVLVATLSGRQSQFGFSVRNAAYLAVDRVNAQGGVNGRQLRLTVIDDGYDPKKISIELAKYLGGEPRIIIGPYTSNILPGVMDGIKRTSSVVLSPTVSTDSMNGKEDAFFRLMPAASKQGELLARRALGRGAMRAAVLIDTKNADYTRAVADGFRRVYRAGGGTVVYDGEFDSSTVDHAQIVSKMNATSPQIAVLSASSIDTAMIAQRASAAGVKIPFIAAMWANTDNLIQLGGKTVEGVELVDMDPQQRSERLDAFTRGYEQQFGESPLMGAVLTSDAIDVVVSALQRIDGGLSPLTFSRALSGQKSYGGLYGQISFDRFGDVSRPLYLSVIENAKKKTIPCEEKGAC